jgi:hypothetical protein
MNASLIAATNLLIETAVFNTYNISADLYILPTTITPSAISL